MVMCEEHLGLVKLTEDITCGVRAGLLLGIMLRVQLIWFVCSGIVIAYGIC